MPVETLRIRDLGSDFQMYLVTFMAFDGNSKVSVYLPGSGFKWPKANGSKTKYFMFWESISKTAKLFKIQAVAH